MLTSHRRAGLIAVAASLSLQTVASAAYVDAVTAQNPLFYFRFNETAGGSLAAQVDNSATAAPAAISNTVAVNQTAAPALRPAGGFNGFEATNTWFNFAGAVNTDFVQSLTNPLATGGTAAGSQSHWFRTTTGAPTAASSTSFGRFYQGDAGATGALYSFIDGTGKVGLRIANLSNDATVLADARTAAAYNDGEWHHVLTTWDDATNAVAVYVDGGALAGGETVVGTYADGTAFTFTGRHQFGKGPNNASLYQGAADELAFWTTALTATQARDQYLAALPEPATLAAASLGAIALRRRRRATR